MIWLLNSQSNFELLRLRLKTIKRKQDSKVFYKDKTLILMILRA